MKRKLDSQAPAPADKKQKTAPTPAPCQQKKKGDKSNTAQPPKKTSVQKQPSHFIAKSQKLNSQSSTSGNAAQRTSKQDASNQPPAQVKKRKAEEEPAEPSSKRAKLESGSQTGKTQKKKKKSRKSNQERKDASSGETPIGEPYTIIRGVTRFSTNIIEVPIGYQPLVNEKLTGLAKNMAKAGAATRQAQNSTKRGLFSIPPELREMIYALVIPQKKPIAITQKSPTNTIRAKAPLLFTCKKVYHECIDLFYESNTFMADNTETLNGWLKALEPSHLRSLRAVYLADPAKPDKEKTGVELEIAATETLLAASKRAKLETTLSNFEKKKLKAADAALAHLKARMVEDQAKSLFPNMLPTVQNPKTGMESRGPYTLRRVRRTLESIRCNACRKGLGRDVVRMELCVTASGPYWRDLSTIAPRDAHKFIWVTASDIGPEDDDMACRFVSETNRFNRRQRYTREKTKEEIKADVQMRKVRKEKARVEKAKKASFSEME